MPLSTPDDVAGAARRARAAQRLWAARPLRERTAVLSRLHDLLLERQSDVLDLIQIENGKARQHAFEEVVDVANVARHYAMRARGYLADRRVVGLVPGLTATRVVRHPVGVVGVVSPWNMPFTLVLGDVLPALVAGNAVLLRPDLQTTLTALWAAELCQDAGLPADVLQVVTGHRDIAQAVVDHVDAVIFTGSSHAGRDVAARTGARLIPTEAPTTAVMPPSVTGVPSRTRIRWTISSTVASSGEPRSRIVNSSPPQRATTSLSRW